MNDLRGLISKYRSRGVVPDTNILLLEVVGACHPKRVESFKRTRQFTLFDFDLLNQFLGRFVRIVTTPNIMSEVSNMLKQLLDHEARQAHQLLTSRLEVLDERFVSTSTAANDTAFTRLGVTDAVLVWLAKQGMLVVTDDVRLRDRIWSLGLDCLNFNNIRQGPWTH